MSLPGQEMEHARQAPNQVEEDERIQGQRLIGQARGDDAPNGAQPREVVRYDDRDRMMQQMRNQYQERTEEELAAERERRVAFFCYTLCLMITVATPYHSCDGQGSPSRYTFDYKSWNVVFIFICILHLQKEWCYDVINRWHIEDVITLRTRNRMRQNIAIVYELLHVAWQVYGNFVYFEWRGKDNGKGVNSDEAFLKCMEKKNPGLLTTTLVFLMVGYFFLLIYAIAICFIVNFLFQRGVFDRDNLQQEENLQKILRNLSRVKFSEGAFGQLGPENECIICMQQYSTNDVITTLSCNQKHFFHTNCIEKWIQNRNIIDIEGPKCPICRTVIKVEERQQELFSDQQERKSRRGSLPTSTHGYDEELPQMQNLQ